MINDLKSDTLGQRNFATQKITACIENVNKFELGRMQRVTLEYEDYHVFILNTMKLIITLVGNNNLDWGTLLSFENELCSICDVLDDVV